MPIPDNLAGLEGAFNEAPSLATARAWHAAAVRAHRDDEISLAELTNISNAVRTWAKVNAPQVMKADSHAS